MSISLNPAVVESHLVGGTVVETNPTGAVGNITIDYIGNTLSFYLLTGTLNGSGISVGAHASSQAMISMNMATGVWQNNQTGASGTIQAAALTSLIGVLKGLRNSAEAFAVAQGMIAGIQVPW